MQTVSTGAGCPGAPFLEDVAPDITGGQPWVGDSGAASLPGGKTSSVSSSARQVLEMRWCSLVIYSCPGVDRDWDQNGLLYLMGGCLGHAALLWDR